MMHRARQRVIAAFAMVMAAGVAIAQSTRPADLSNIIRDLGSTEFQVRERAKAELAKLSPDQVETLRQAEKAATDEEVKARLRSRIGEMELYALLHPKLISVEIQDGTLSDLAKAVEAQTGWNCVSVSGTPTKISLKVQDQPLWEIMRRVNEIVPVKLSSVIRETPLGQRNGIGVTPLTLPVAPNQATSVFVTDGVAVIPQVTTGNPATGNWTLSCNVFTDPRVRLAKYSRILSVDRMVDQDGKVLSPPKPASVSISTEIRGVPALTCSATFPPEPRLTRLRELTGMVEVEVIETEKKIVLDLTKTPIAPVPLPDGIFSVTKEPDGALTLKVTSTTPAPNGNPPEPRPTRLSVRVMDSDNKSLVLSSISGINAQTTIRREMTQRAQSVEITLIDKTRLTRLPIVIRDWPVVAAPPQVAPMRGN